MEERAFSAPDHPVIREAERYGFVKRHRTFEKRGRSALRYAEEKNRYLEENDEK